MLKSIIRIGNYEKTDFINYNNVNLYYYNGI